uniref:Uncharacterized protein n=1 Tax=Chromera velia CCMP2878 TaxID=1169474 RepID=A0A0G4I8K9_9ALVE|eukprot:Cvel_1984.t1-p1 / transcript=Cvel_1984.t1 / gene=Cvel_1984 / organism=Chromera_velia_CCMP2878 / gene_product=hypothetical protein / transcript_product=hypothetical protein / location=Cvel_scaffold75:96422-104121(-) / protein_length=427 / sequence_SO=supercontig / SO=protein_coding / is_pseudo=false
MRALFFGNSNENNEDQDGQIELKFAHEEDDEDSDMDIDKSDEESLPELEIPNSEEEDKLIQDFQKMVQKFYRPIALRIKMAATSDQSQQSQQLHISSMVLLSVSWQGDEEGLLLPPAYDLFLTPSGLDLSLSHASQDGTRALGVDFSRAVCSISIPFCETATLAVMADCLSNSLAMKRLVVPGDPQHWGLQRFTRDLHQNYHILVEKLDGQALTLFVPGAPPPHNEQYHHLHSEAVWSKAKEDFFAAHFQGGFPASATALLAKTRDSIDPINIAHIVEGWYLGGKLVPNEERGRCIDESTIQGSSVSSGREDEISSSSNCYKNFSCISISLRNNNRSFSRSNSTSSITSSDIGSVICELSEPNTSQTHKKGSSLGSSPPPQPRGDESPLSFRSGCPRQLMDSGIPAQPLGDTEPDPKSSDDGDNEED